MCELNNELRSSLSDNTICSMLLQQLEYAKCVDFSALINDLDQDFDEIYARYGAPKRVGFIRKSIGKSWTLKSGPLTLRFDVHINCAVIYNK